MKVIEYNQEFQIGDWKVQPQKNLIYCRDKKVDLEPKVMALLVYLSENVGQVVPKEKLLETVWGDSFVTEQVLKVAIFQLRKSLGDNAKHPNYIKTISKKGYLLTAPVIGRIEPSKPEQSDSSIISSPTLDLPANQPDRHWLKPIIVLSLIISCSIFIWYFTSSNVANSEKTGKIETIVVLPLKNISLRPEEDFFTNGMTESITTEIAQVNQLRVISVSTAMRFNNVEIKPLQLSKELKVTKILEGSVIRSEDKIRLSVRLVNAENESSIWAKTYERNVGDIFNLQIELARDVAQEINLKLNPYPTQNRQVNTQAFDEYLKGRFFWSKRKVENIEKSLEYFEKAITIEPNQPVFHSGLADAYILLAFYSPENSKDYYEKAKSAAHKALNLNNNLAEAHTSLAAVLHKHELDWTGAEEGFQRAIELNPNYPTAHHWYAIYLVSKGEYEKAVAEIDKALELDPYSLILRTDRGWILYVSRRYEESISQLRQTIELDPSFGAYYFLILAYIKNGTPDKAIIEAKTALARKHSPEYVGLLSYALATAGKRDEAIANLKQLENLPQNKTPFYEMAVAYLALGDKQKALDLLEKVIEHRSSWNAFLKTQPELEVLQNDSWFQNILGRVGFK